MEIPSEVWHRFDRTNDRPQLGLRCWNCSCLIAPDEPYDPEFPLCFECSGDEVPA